MLNKSFKLLASVMLAGVILVGCGGTPNNHDLNENNQNQPPMNENNGNFENENSNFNEEEDLNDNWEENSNIENENE